MGTVILPDSDAILIKALGDFCVEYLDFDNKKPLVVRGYVNKVSKPKTNDYVLITPMSMTRLATNRHEWQGEKSLETITQPVRRRVQIDCFGSMAAVWAKILSTLLRDYVGCDFLKPYGIAPLFVEDPQEMASDTGEEQYVPRFMLGAMLQQNDLVGTALDFFKAINVKPYPQA